MDLVGGKQQLCPLRRMQQRWLWRWPEQRMQKRRLRRPDELGLRDVFKRCLLWLRLRDQRWPGRWQRSQTPYRSTVALTSNVILGLQTATLLLQNQAPRRGQRSMRGDCCCSRTWHIGGRLWGVYFVGSAGQQS